MAQVHHGFAASERRTSARVPRDLAAIGRSLRAFVTKHDGQTDLGVVMRAERDAQRRRLLRFMRDGLLLPGDVGRILRSFDQGWNDTQSPELTETTFAQPDVFKPMPQAFAAYSVVLSGRFWQAKRLFREAEDLVSKGNRVTVLLMSFSNAFHRVYFTSSGFWVQSGGQFGKSVRSGRFFQQWRGKSRIRHEIARVACVRKIDVVD